MAQTLTFPGALFFFCEKAANLVATPVCRSDLTLKTLEAENPNFVAKLRKVGVKYRNRCRQKQTRIGQGRSWKDTLTVGASKKPRKNSRRSDTDLTGSMTAVYRFRPRRFALTISEGVTMFSISCCRRSWLTVAADDKEPRLAETTTQ